ncbi:hypothetical protein [Longirhabdus pacifica]|uniref:hypothetical protein n=1 Tax=Longirhabdus pacifica TaxID=2305227 RepID=UPI00100936D1|nr:hypothetical protein [Longirhabdus pacifica]
MKIYCAIPSQFSLRQRNELRDRIPFISEHINMVKVNTSENKIVLEYEGTEEESTVLKSEMNTLIEHIAATRWIEKPAVKKYETKHHHSLPIKQEQQHPHPKKTSAYYNEVELALLEKLDAEMLAIAKQVKAQMRSYPTILHEQNMQRNQYHKNFPQHIYAVHHIPHQHKIIEQFRKSNEGQDQWFTHTGDYLQPCICYHCYEELGNQKWDNHHIFTAKGPCFRHEVEWKLNTFRKNEFMMREIVFVGDQQWVIFMREQLMQAVWTLFCKLDMTGHIIAAHDPFFHYDDVQQKAMFQLVTDAKYELEVNVGDDKHYSIASFNYCEDVLCEKYNITGRDGQALYSGCVAFGLDRWLAALFYYYGQDMKKLPL